MRDPEAIIRTPPGSPADEQDEAAGGRQNRIVRLPDGRTARGSVALKFFGGRRIYAYLRYWADGATQVAYLGDATADTRAAALKRAWQNARERGLVD